MSYLGEYTCRLDAKGRLVVPNGLRKQLIDDGLGGFVVNRGFEGCLGLYPIRDWEQLSVKLNKLNLFIAKNRAFVRKFQNGATKLTVDGMGRILLPKGLIEYAGIDKEVVLFAYANRIEIWDKKTYEEQVVDEDLDDFSDLAEEVMGGDFDE